MQPSRRAFLFGRRLPRTPWDTFLQRLQRAVQGRVQVLDAAPPGRARLVPARAEDVRHARALCVEYGVALLLEGGGGAALQGTGTGTGTAAEAVAAGTGADATGAKTVAAGAAAEPNGPATDPNDPAADPNDPAADPNDLAADATGAAIAASGAVTVAAGAQADALAGRAVLWVDPSGLATLVPGPAAGQWRAQPGCRLGELAAAGLEQFRAAPADATLAAWLAQPHAWPPGATAASGVLQADVLLSDGTAETLGPFGAGDVRPLRSATVQRLVPALFQLAASADAAACRRQPEWPCRYRLDALLPEAPAEVNLAHLLLGHGGALAWVDEVLLGPGRPRPAASAMAPAELAGPARRLALRTKDAFDPVDLYAP